MPDRRHWWVPPDGRPCVVRDRAKINSCFRAQKFWPLARRERGAYPGSGSGTSEQRSWRPKGPAGKCEVIFARFLRSGLGLELGRSVADAHIRSGRQLVQCQHIPVEHPKLHRANGCRAYVGAGSRFCAATVRTVRAVTATRIIRRRRSDHNALAKPLNHRLK